MFEKELSHIDDIWRKIAYTVTYTMVLSYISKIIIQISCTKNICKLIAEFSTDDFL